MINDIKKMQSKNNLNAVFQALNHSGLIKMKKKSLCSTCILFDQNLQNKVPSPAPDS